MLCCVVLCMPRQQVRSCTLDTKVWEPAVVGLFQHIGNEFANRVWEGGAAPGGGGGGGGPATSGKVGRAAGLAGCRTRLHVCRLGCRLAGIWQEQDQRLTAAAAWAFGGQGPLPSDRPPRC